MRDSWKRSKALLQYVSYLITSFGRSSRQARTRAKLHHVYYLLAAFDIATVGGGLYLSHNLMTLYVQSVNVNQEWSVRLKNYSKLGDLAQAVNAPGNDVFDSRDVEKERSIRDAGLDKFTAHLRKLRESLPQGNGKLGAALDRVETAMGEMMAEADLIFRYFDSGEPGKAGERMATMDRKYGVLTREVNRSAELIQGIQSEHFAAQLGEARKLRRFEYLIGALILLMVGFVAIYGHKIGGLFQKQYDQLSSANAMLEERTAKLQEANKNINSLNAELARTIVQLREAQAELMRQKDELSLQNARFNAALRHLPVGLSMFDSEQRLIVCNNTYGEIYDLPLELRQPGTRLADLVRYYVKSETGGDDSRGVAVSDWIAQRCAKVANGQLFTDIQNLSDGRTICVRVGPTAEGGWVDVMEDVTEQHLREAQIAYLARHDSLTNLPNRLLLREQLEQTLKSARRGEKLAVLCLDLDRFKEVNDTLGHPTGDALLKTVAERLRKCVREADVVARVGGDEFVVLQVSADPLTEAAALASRLMEVISEPYDVNGRPAVIGTSIGIAIAPDDEANPDMLLAQADMALYRSKDDGRGTYCFFEEEMNTRAHARRHLEHDLRLALGNGEFELNYQPFVNLECNEVSGFEALLRWRHPQRGMVSPGDFIPLAEETGLIVAIGEWVLREACAEAANWPAPIRVSVNVSPVQFKSRKLAETVINALAASGLAAQRLELEITESVILQDSDATLATLRQLHDFGVRIALDDFGTGYSSLSYLHKFPIDRIKIDRCFVASLSTGEEHTLAIVRAISSLGRTLGMGITAEGVETQHQLDMIRLEGCNEMQGYIYSAARPAGEIRRHFLTRADGQTSEEKTVAA